MLYPVKDLGAHVVAKAAGSPLVSSAPSAITAAGTGDNTKVTGQTINNINGGKSAILVITGVATLAAAATFSATVEIAESSDGSSFDTAVALLAATVLATGGGGGTTEYFAYALSVDLSARKQYCRFNVTPDLSAGGTDKVTAAWALIVGGDDVLPAA